MPHQCVRCGKIYEDGAAEILKGCPCGAKLFFFIKKEVLKQVRDTIEAIENLTPQEKIEMERDVFDLVELDIKKDRPVILDIESIRTIEPGKFEIDLVHLFRKDPLIFKVGEGKYIIDLASAFKR